MQEGFLLGFSRDLMFLDSMTRSSTLSLNFIVIKVF